MRQTMAYVVAMQDQAALRETLPTHTRPAGFANFWAQTVTGLEAIPSAARRESQHELGDGILVDKLSFASLGGCRIHGYWIRHEKAEGRELVVTTHGYNSRCEPTLQDKARFALGGANVMAFDARGFGASRQAVDVSPHGYITTGIESPEQSILRGAVCDYVRAHTVTIDLLQAPALRTVFHGYSFAGGLACMAQAVSQRADLLAIGVPTFGWVEGRRQLVKRGSGLEINKLLERHPELEPRALDTLAYFDTMNHAPRVKCETIVGVGLDDEVVPAATVFAIVNHLGCQPTVLEFPYSHTKRPEEALWRRFDETWLRRLHHPSQPAD